MQAAIPPSLSVLSAKWFPRNERGFLSATIYCGFPLGALLTALISGILCDLELMDGWPLVFYTFGTRLYRVAKNIYILKGCRIHPKKERKGTIRL